MGCKKERFFLRQAGQPTKYGIYTAETYKEALTFVESMPTRGRYEATTPGNTTPSMSKHELLNSHSDGLDGHGK